MKNKNITENIKLTDFLLENLTTAVFLVDKEMKVKKINNAYKALFEKEEYEVLNELCGNTLGCSFAVNENKLCGTTEACKECSIRNCVMKGFKETEEVEDTYVTREFYINNKPKMKYFRIKTKYVKYNSEDMAIIAIDDITELEEEKNMIKDMAQKDYLTGLYNRRYLFEIGEKMFQNHLRGNMKIAAAMIDIDFFKKINDTYGHMAGDFILKTVSDTLKDNLRKADVIARYGGEEFCILLSIKNEKDGFDVMEKVRSIIENQNFIYEDKKIDVTVSIGVTEKIEVSLEKSIQNADEMLYKAKESGRNRVIAE